MNIGLILIDVQNDYFPGGAMELSGMSEAAANAAKILDSFRNNNYPVFHIQHISARAGATFFLPDTWGCQINAAVCPLTGEAVIHKNFPDSFQKTVLQEELAKNRVDELVVCGAMSHMCIDTTVRSAFEKGYKITVIADACATCDLSYKDITVAAGAVHASFMAALGAVFANVVDTAEYLGS